MSLHAVVESVVNACLEAVDAEAPGLIEGLYLTGSVALGDFRPRASDIDFVAVTSQPLDADATAAVGRAHARLRKQFPRPVFEGVYVTWDTLASDPARCGHDPVTWHTLARHGIAFRGPDRADLNVWTNAEALAEWTLGNLDSYWWPLLGRTARWGQRGSLAALTTYGTVWIVLGVTRLHYTLATGEIGSKKDAGRYSLRTFPEEWHRVIQESLRLRQSDRASPDLTGALRGLLDRESLYRTSSRRSGVRRHGDPGCENKIRGPGTLPLNQEGMRFPKKPEVMSPAGHWPQLHAAIEAGADACYFGLKHFSARAKVGFDLSELPEAMRTLHRRGVRGYLTFNTLVFEHELAEAARVIGAIAEAGVDALIVQDIGVLKMARQIAPDLELHASTQTSITSAEGVEFARSQGADRVTLARELSLEEVAAIYAKTNADLEIFVHGALCVAYSGQCFSSEAWGGRSANRGQCAQACRLPYEMMVDGEARPLADARYLLSPGDLSALGHVPQIIAAGVSCMKIEGRYKAADYVALTTRAYRQAVDDAWAGRESSITPRQEQELEQVYSRGLGPYFISGVNHQNVVNGRNPRHRGVQIGTVATVRDPYVYVQPSAAHEIAPLKAGDGVVVDAADWRSPQEDEEGGRVYQVAPQLDGTLELSFANNTVNFRRIRPGDLLWRTHDPDLDRVVRPFLGATAPVAKQKLTVHATTGAGEKLRTCWSLRNGISVTVESPAALGAAQNRGLTEESLREQFGRLGNTPYELAELSAEITGSVFAPASLLNRMRREAVEKLEELQSRPPARSIHPAPNLHRETHAVGVATAQLHVLVRNPEQLEAAIAAKPDSITLDYLDLYGLRPSVQRVKGAGVQVRVASPRILKPGESRIVAFLVSLDCPLLVRATGILHTLKQSASEQLIGDFSLNTANTLTAEAYLELGLDRLTPTHDLNAAQISALAGTMGPERMEVIAYQHLPVFHTEHCVFCRFLSTGTSHLDCGRPCEKHRVALCDSHGRAHPVVADAGCRNTVFGAEAQEASAHMDAWRDAGIRHFRLEFVHESAREVQHVTAAFQDYLDGRKNSAQLASELRRYAPEGVTEGSLFVPAGFERFPILQ